MKLICEVVEQIKFVVEETENKQKNFFIEGVFLQCNKENRNKRMYVTEVMQKEVDRYRKNYIEKNRAYGELGHPPGPAINLERACIMIKELKQDGDNFIGKAKVLDTPYGNIVRNLIQEEAQLGVSSRGMGSLEPNKEGVMVVQDDFYLATAADVVADPSAPDAFVRGIMEGVEWIWENGILKAEKINEYKKEIIKTPSSRLNEVKLKVFESFFKDLSTK